MRFTERMQQRWQQRQQQPAPDDGGQLDSAVAAALDPDVAAAFDRAGWSYASELLDDDTCDACRTVDGREYPTHEDALRDYPGGGTFAGCTSRHGCRGTLVLVSANETPATLRWPYGIPPGQQ